MQSNEGGQEISINYMQNPSTGTETGDDATTTTIDNTNSNGETEHQLWLTKIQKNPWNLRHAPNRIRATKQIVLAAIEKVSYVHKFASYDLKNNDEDVEYQYWRTRIKENGFALSCAPRHIRASRPIVRIAIQQTHYGGRTLAYASPELENDIEIVLEAMENYKWAYRFAGPRAKQNKDLVLKAINLCPDNIKYVPENLKRNHDVLIAAGMFDKDHDEKRKKRRIVKTANDVVPSNARPRSNSKDNNKILQKIVLSTRFSLNQSCQSIATKFTKKFKDHAYVRDSGKFIVYAPNAFEKQSCDPNWTDFDWPCRGTSETCRYKNILTTTTTTTTTGTDDDVENESNYEAMTTYTGTSIGRPTNECCWRYSFRFQLEEAKASGGFMLQLVESGERIGKGDDAKLGNGQQIEYDMAQQLNLKIFHVYRPTSKEGYEWNFHTSHIEQVISAIKDWYNCTDHGEEEGRRCWNDDQQKDDNVTNMECVVVRPVY